jgi:tRNA(Ile)-lysidine synthase
VSSATSNGDGLAPSPSPSSALGLGLGHGEAHGDSQGLTSGLVRGLARCLDRCRAERGGVAPALLAVAASGGGDSSALLLALARFTPADWAAAGWPSSPELRAVHCDHGMTDRAPALEAAALATAALAGVPCTVLRLEIRLARGDSAEAIARLHRYRALAEWLPPQAWLLTAHHADDQAETLLLQAFRGAGLEGLAAMPWQAGLGQGTHARPLLGTTRAELQAAGAALGLQDGKHYTLDPMNVDPHLDRAFLRHTVWPLIAERWPGANLTLSRSAGHLQDALRVVDEAVAADLAPLLAPLDCRGFPVGRKPAGGTPRTNALPPHVTEPPASALPSGTAPGFLPLLAATTLDQAGLKALPLARRAQVLRAWVRGEGHRSPPAARVGTLVDQMLEARGDAAPCVRWGDSEIHAWRGRYYLGQRVGKTLAQRLAAAADPPPPWRQELPRMGAWPVIPGGPATDLGPAGRLTLVATTTGPRLLLPPGQAVVVRGRVGGERLRIRPLVQGAHQDVRKLLQAAAVPPWLRDDVPYLWLVPAEMAAVAERRCIPGELAAVGDGLLDVFLLAKGEEPGWRVVWEPPFA